MIEFLAVTSIIEKCEFIKLELLIFVKKAGSSHGPVLFIVLVWD